MRGHLVLPNNPSFRLRQGQFSQTRVLSNPDFAKSGFYRTGVSLNQFCPYKTDSAWANWRSQFAMRSAARFCEPWFSQTKVLQNPGFMRGHLALPKKTKIHASPESALPNSDFSESGFRQTKVLLYARGLIPKNLLRKGALGRLKGY